jgi:hypothetical protein
MLFILSLLHKLLLVILSAAGVADVAGPRLVAEVRATSGRELQAVSAAGRWRGTTGQGRQVTLDLRARGATLTGTLTLDEQSAAIADGMVEKRTITFKAAVDGRTVTFTGEVGGEGITLSMEGARNPVTLIRVK